MLQSLQVKEIIIRELPGLLRADPEMSEFILELTRERYADKAETESRFDRILREIQRDREEQSRKWDEQSRKCEANQTELRLMRDEQNRKWDEQNRKWEANQTELRLMRDEQNRKWEANQTELRLMREESARILDVLEAQARKHDQSIGALGARWGLHTEKSFRNALRGILYDHFGVEVINVNEWDDEGEVFGRPEQIELDIVIKNGVFVLAEIKSSMSKSDMYAFLRKAEFYQRRHKRKATRLIVISPMVDDRAMAVAEKEGITVFSYAEDAGPDVWQTPR